MSGSGMSGAVRFSQRLESSGLVPGEPDYDRALHAYLTEPVEGLWCRCGRPLRRFEADGRTCEGCIEILYAEKAEKSTTEVVMERIGVPPRYRSCTISSWNGPFPEKVAGWMARPDRDLVVSGPDNGCGKTHAATAALYSVALDQAGPDRRRFHAFWMASTTLAVRMSDEKFDAAHPTFTKSSRVGVLLIDDLGAERKVTPSATEDVTLLIEERFRHKRPTIVTTNLTPEQLVEYDPRIASRLLAGVLAEMSSGTDRRWE